MIVKHFDIKTPEAKLPKSEGWEQSLFGYYEMTKCESADMKAEWAKREQSAKVEGKTFELEFERDCFLSILSDMNKKHVNMFELGAGWGRMSLSLAGVIDFKLIPINTKSYHSLAVEGEPTHYQWAKEHFEHNDINCTALHAAISNNNGTCRFNTYGNPNDRYGQSIDSLINRHKIPSFSNIYNFIFHGTDRFQSLKNYYNLLTRSTVKVPMYTIDRLIKVYNFEQVDIIHMDVQGAEYNVVLGAADSIQNDLIGYFLIGTHDRQLNDALEELLSPKFDLIVNIFPHSIDNVNGFLPIECEDGIQLYKRKNL